jgi:hypothetical protein
MRTGHSSIGRIGIFMAIGLLTAACSPGAPAPSAAPSAEAHDIKGDLLFLGVYDASSTTKCVGANAETLPGGEVTLTDGAGVTVGVAHLAEAPGSGSGPVDAAGSATCHETFSFPAVKKADFYKVKIGSISGPTYSYTDLVGLNWTLTLHL